MFMYVENPHSDNSQHLLSVRLLTEEVCSTSLANGKGFGFYLCWVMHSMMSAYHQRRAGGSLLDELVMLWHWGRTRGNWPTEQLFSSGDTPLSPGSEMPRGLTWADWVLPTRGCSVNYFMHTGLRGQIFMHSMTLRAGTLISSFSKGLKI